MSSIVVAGDTSGSVTLQAPAVAGSTTLTLPTVSGNIPIAPTITTFTGSSTFTKRATSTVVQVLVVGGGGGGGFLCVMQTFSSY